MNAQQQTRARKRLLKAGLPIPPELQLRGKGWPAGKKHKPKPIAVPKFRKGLDSSMKFKMRQRFIRLGLPVPEWCAAKREMQTTKRNLNGMPMSDYEAFSPPPWARFKAIDDCGDAWFFETEPKRNDTGWSSKNRISLLGEVSCPDWMQSKRAI